MDKFKVSVEIMKDKIQWELIVREEREDSPWTEEWEFQQQEEKEVYTLQAAGEEDGVQK